MIGNVGELCHEYYEADYHLLPTTDPTGPVIGTSRVSRNGGFDGSLEYIRVASRGPWGTTYRSYLIGFRPVRTLP